MRNVLATIDRFNAGTRVVALVDPRANALQDEFPGPLGDAVMYDSADRMLDAGGLDGVLIGTRCSDHAPNAVKVLERDLPLFLEKPIATSWEQLASLEAAAERSRSQVVVSFPLRLSAMCETAREIVDAGTIGPIQQVQAVNNVPFYAGGYYHGWMRDEAETGGLWLQKATHDFDYINSLIRQRPIHISAMESKTVFTGDMPVGLRCVDCSRQVECLESPYNLFRQGITAKVEPNDWLCSFAPDTGNHDSASAMIMYESGIHAVYTQNFYTRRGAAARGATLVGYRGTIKFDWYTDELVVHHHHDNRIERHRFESKSENHHGGDAALAADFLAIARGDGVSRAPLAAGLESVRMCLAARDSCRSAAFQPLAVQRT
jgi:predicted dehydrogenase